MTSDQRNDRGGLRIGCSIPVQTRENLVDLHATVLGDREQHVEDLRGLEELGRVEQQLVDRMAARFEVALELRAL